MGEASALPLAALERPGIIEATRTAVSREGVADRYRFLAGDMFQVGPNERFDLVLARHLLHLFDAEPAAALVARLADMLRPGGRLAVIDIVPDEDRTWDAAVETYRLGLRMRTATGGVHSRPRIRKWMNAAGLGSVEFRRIDSAPGLALVTGMAP